MAKSVEEQLESTLAAIDAVENKGQRFTIKDRELWRADISELHKRAEMLQRQVDRKANGGLKVQRIVPL
jgi:hypothetical protein